MRPFRAKADFERFIFSTDLELEGVRPEGYLSYRIPISPPLPTSDPHKSSQFLLQEMLRLMARLEINVHVRALHVRQAFKLNLQVLGDVVGGAQRLGRVHDDVNLDDDARARVVGADGVEGEDLGGVRHCCRRMLAGAALGRLRF